MLSFTTVIDEATGEQIVEVPLTGLDLLETPLFNKGSAFTDDERTEFGLHGLLPPHVGSIEEQVARCYDEFRRHSTSLHRHVYLRDLQDRNEVLFYRLMTDHVAEMMPVIYTPTVGEACRLYSHIYRRPRGLYLAYEHRDRLDGLLANRPFREVDVIVVTDGERILGLGDLGIGGMGIPIGKLSLYTLCGGIHPARTLPVFLDVGTDNPEDLSDSLYLGSRHGRVRGQDYDDFIEAFVAAVDRALPGVLLQWEDFGQANARRLLERYRDRLCTFNDDIQGTAAVAVAAIRGAGRIAGTRMADQRFVLLGGGSAGTGIAEAVVAAMAADGLCESEALGRVWLVGRQGLVHTGMPDLRPSQRRYAQPRERLAGWPQEQELSLATVVENVRPTVLIGATGQPGAFPEGVVRAMARHVQRPAIFPLSNPTSQSEAIPADLITWTEGRALVATGSPFDDVTYRGQRFPIAQCNNAYVFPGLGQGVLASGARRVTDGMFQAAARALAEFPPAAPGAVAPMLPPLEEIVEVSRHVTQAVANQARAEGLAAEATAEDLRQRIDRRWWSPHYRRLRPSR